MVQHMHWTSTRGILPGEAVGLVADLLAEGVIVPRWLSLVLSA